MIVVSGAGAAVRYCEGVGLTVRLTSHAVEIFSADTAADGIAKYIVTCTMCNCI